MKREFMLAAFLLSTSLSIDGQVTNLPGVARRIIRGGALPATCRQGDAFYKLDANEGQYNGVGNPCVWTLVGPGAGVTSVAGTANEITVSSATGAVTFSFPAGGVTLPGITTGTFSGNLTGNASGSAGTVISIASHASTELSDTTDLARGASSLPTVNAIPKVASAGVLTESMISCTGSPLTCTVYDPTAATGSTRLEVRAGVGQGSTPVLSITNFASMGLLQVQESGLIRDEANGYWQITPGLNPFRVYNGGLYSWSSDGAASGMIDLAIGRNAAGIRETNSGTAGQWGSDKTGYLEMQSLATPGAPTVTPTCTAACTQTWTYTIVAVLADGTRKTAPGATGTTAVQNATLDVTNFNVITWSAVTGATSYEIRRTVSGGTPAPLGKIGTATALTFTDDGDAGDGSAAPENSTGTVNALRYHTTTNCTSGASPAVCGAASAGAVALPAAGTTLTVNTTAVNAASRILITENTTVGTELSVTCNTTIARTYAVTTITAGTSFVITTSAAPVTNPSCLNFLLIN